MERSFFKSIRWQIIKYGILSIVLAFISDFIISFGIYYIINGFGFANRSDGVRDEGLPPDFNKDINSFDGSENRPELKKTLISKIQDLFGLNLSTLIIISIALIITFIFLYILYFSFFNRKLARDLNKISVDIQGIAKGKFEGDISFLRDDELSDISDSVNELSETINKLMDAERQALRANKELITCIAHDLRTPITSVVGYIQLAVDEEHYNNEQRKKYATIATDKADRLEKMIEDLFNFTKITSGEIKLKVSKIDLIRLVEQMVEEFYPMFEDNSITTTFDKNADSAVMMADPSLMARAISNLMSNAVKYGKDGKRLIIVYEKKDDGCDLSLTNFGLAIPEESLKRVFDKFYRVEDSRSLSTGGTGLGLNIAKEVIVLHGGDITVKSDFSGTTFTIHLPEEVFV